MAEMERNEEESKTQSPSFGQSDSTSNSNGWSSPDDPEDPHNWPFGKKIYHASITAAYAFTTTSMASLYSSGTDEVAERFGVSRTVSLLGISMYCLGLSFGPVLAAPLSETLGRSIVYRASLPIAALFTIGCAVAQNIGTVIVCRLFAGFFAAPALSIGGGTLADIFHPSSRGVAMSLFLLAPFLGPAVGPIIGGFVTEKMGFRWLEWVMLFFMIATYIYSFWMSETYKPILLARRRKRSGVASPPNSTNGVGALRMFLTVTLFRPITMLATEPIVAFCSLYVAVDFGILFTFFASFPIVYSRVYHFSAGQIGLTFLPIMVGCFIATVTCLLCDSMLYKKQLRKMYSLSYSDGNSNEEQPPRKERLEPEHRLYAAMIGSIGLPIGLFWFAWTATKGVHWISPIMATAVFAWGNLCVFVSAMIYLIDAYGPQYGASAVSANGFARYIFSAAFPLFAIQMYDRLGIAWATSLLGFLSVALLPVPWILFVWGSKIRQKSAYKITEH